MSRLQHHLPQAFPLVERALLADGTTVEFILVDSDADVPRRGHERLLARGRFHSQISHLRAHFGAPDPDPDPVRVLIVHHALSIENGPAPAGSEPFPIRPWNPLRKLEINLRTMASLQRFVADYGIRVVLTGHVHTPRLSVFTAQGSGGNAVDVLEARCGTTTQLDRYSPSHRRQIRQAEQAFHTPPRPPLPRNSLLLHELWRRDDGRREWRCAVHTRADGVGFVGPGNVRAPLPARQLTRAMVL